MKSFVSSRWRRLAMGCITVWLFLGLLQSITVFSAEDTPILSRSSYFRTLQNKQLKGYVFLRLYSPSLLSCNQQCMRSEWCTSTNYKIEGTCELNKHDTSLITDNSNFHDEKGATFSMLLKVTSMSSQLIKMAPMPSSPILDNTVLFSRLSRYWWVCNYSYNWGTANCGKWFIYYNVSVSVILGNLHYSHPLTNCKIANFVLMSI